MERLSVLRAVDYKTELVRTMCNLVQAGSVTLAAIYWINSPIDFTREELEEKVLVYIAKEHWDEIVSIHEALK